MIQITRTLALDERELEERFLRAGGPGGQNVNKLSTAVQLRFDVRRSPSLPEDVRTRLAQLAGHRLTQDGVLVLTARRFRTQERNRQDALDRLVDLIRKAVERPKVRKPTKPTAAARLERRRRKERQAQVKRQRAKPPPES